MSVFFEQAKSIVCLSEGTHATMRPLVSTWEQRKFSDLTDRVSIQSSDSDLPQVEYEDIISGEGTLNKDLRDKEGGKTGIKFYAGDVLYGKLRPYLMNWLYPQFNGVAVGDFWVLRATECDSSFLYRLIQTDSFQRLANVSSGSKMPRADWNLISQSFFAVPADHAEQKAIAKSLAELDNLITLHQRKYDKLCTVKKSMLDKMFPKPGETEPEIRFEGFTDPWEQRKLGEVATRHDNLRIPITAKDRIPGDTPYYGANGIQDYVEGYTHEGEFVLVAEDGATDLDNYPVQLISGLSWVNNHAHVIKAIPDVAQNRFIMYLIKSMDIASYLVGGTRSKLNAEVLMGIELKLPSNSEQIYIGALLSTLDSLITLHQREPRFADTG